MGIRIAHLAAALFCAATYLSAPVARAQDAAEDPVGLRAALASGEFTTARTLIAQLPDEQRDSARAELAIALMRAGNRGAAVDAAVAIEQPQVLKQTIPNLRSPYEPASPVFAPVPATARNGGGFGGGTIADFTQLMELIQTTIVPDTWEVLGGPSTMHEYRSGIYVDPDGLVRDVAVEASDSLVQLRARVVELGERAAGTNADWTRPSALRCVSLRRLQAELLRRTIAGMAPTREMRNLAGLSEVRYVVLTGDDIVLCGEVGGIDLAAAPWPRDVASGRSALGLEMLVAAISAVQGRASFGCSIDPTREGLAAAAQVASQVGTGDIPPATAADALADALGRQQIRLFHVAGDNPLAWVLVEADRHMKQLALGQHAMPPGVRNYLDLLESSVREHPSQGAPSGQLLRMWFAPQPKHVRHSTDGTVMEIGGLPLRLVSAREFADLRGDRHQEGPDPVGEAFAREFTEHFADIANLYPVYDRLRGGYELTAAMELASRQLGAEAFVTAAGALAVPDMVLVPAHAVPRECDSIAVRHTIRTPGKRHEVFVASGGIEIGPGESVAADAEVYPSLDGVANDIGTPPVRNTRWWWD